MRPTVLALLAALVAAAPAGADILWDQSDVNEFGAGYYNSQSGSLPFGLTLFTLSDVTVPATGWNVDSITTWFTAIDPNWGLGISTGKLHVFPKTGTLPTQDPTLSVDVPMSSVLVGARFEVTASSLNLDLPPGDYWIGITPVAPGGFFGPEIQVSSFSYLGSDSPSYDLEGALGPAGWTIMNPGVDASIRVDGTPLNPVPAGSSTWGRIKAAF